MKPRLLLFCTAITACASRAPQPNTVVDTTPIRFDIHVPDYPVTAGPEDRRFEMTLTNTSAHTLWINAQMRLVPSYAPNGEITIDIIGPSGRQIRTECLVMPPRDTRYVAVEPGQHIAVQANLYCHPPFDTVGTYTAQAVYQDRNGDRVPPAPPGTERFTGAASAPIVQFRVKSAP